MTAVAVLPFAVTSNKAGFEVFGPMALVILGGLFTATLYALWILPALYSSFGAGVAPEAAEDDMDEVAV